MSGYNTQNIPTAADLADRLSQLQQLVAVVNYEAGQCLAGLSLLNPTKAGEFMRPMERTLRRLDFITDELKFDIEAMFKK